MKERDIVVFSETAEDEALLDKAEDALSQARAITKNIKYDDSALNIMLELGSIVDELGDEEVKKDIEYAEDAVREANNSLESAVYGLEEPFEDLVRTLRNKIDDEEMDRQDQEWEDQKRREQEQESKLVAPTAKGKKMLDHMREPLVDGDVSMANSAIDAEFINWGIEKYGDDMFKAVLKDINNPKVLERLKQEYRNETGQWAGDGGTFKHGPPGNRRSRQEEGKLDGYYLEKDAMELWLQDNPGKTERDWKYIGVDVSDEYTAKIGGIKGRYLGKGASEWNRGGKKDDMDRPPRLNKITHKGKGYKRRGFTGESEDDVDYKNMRAGEFAKAHGDQWDLTAAEEAAEEAAEFLHDLVEPILDSFASRDDLEAYMADYMPVLGRKYSKRKAIKKAFELLPITGDAMPTENIKKLKEPSRSTYRHENITTGPTRSNVKLSELSPARDNSANERAVGVLIRSALTDPKGEDVYELFAELESINPELADLYKDVALHQYEVQIEEGLTEVKRWQAIAGLVVLLGGLLGINNRLAQKAYDSSHQMQQLIQVYAVAQERGDDAKMAELRQRIKTHQVRLDIGKGDVDFDGKPGNDDIKDLDYLNPIGDMGGADFKWPGDPNQQQEAKGDIRKALAGAGLVGALALGGGDKEQGGIPVGPPGNPISDPAGLYAQPDATAQTLSPKTQWKGKGYDQPGNPNYLINRGLDPDVWANMSSENLRKLAVNGDGTPFYPKLGDREIRMVMAASYNWSDYRPGSPDFIGDPKRFGPPQGPGPWDASGKAWKSRSTIEARKPTTSSTHSTTKDIKKHDPAHGHTHPEGNRPAVCSCITSDGPSTNCTKCGGTGQITSPLRNDPKVESLKWTPGSDKKSWWDK